MFPPQAPWTGLGQLESEINSVKSDLRGKANDYEVRSLVSKVERLEHSNGEPCSACSRLEYELQTLRQDLEELKQRVSEESPVQRTTSASPEICPPCRGFGWFNMPGDNYEVRCTKCSGTGKLRANREHVK